MTLVVVGRFAVREDDVVGIDLTELDFGIVRVTVRVPYASDECVHVHGPAALDLVMRLCPRALEGRRLRWARWAWAFHNLAAHPLLQILHWLGFTRFGLRVHDATIPKPLGLKVSRFSP